MVIGDRKGRSGGFWGFPAGSLPGPSIVAESHAQVFDRTRFFGMGGARKIFYPEFSHAAGKV
jgi:hypothetical protein